MRLNIDATHKCYTLTNVELNMLELNQRRLAVGRRPGL